GDRPIPQRGVVGEHQSATFRQPGHIPAHSGGLEYIGRRSPQHLARHDLTLWLGLRSADRCIAATFHRSPSYGYGARVRHLRSIVYAAVLAPVVWILCAVGFTRDPGFVPLVLAGVAYAILLLAPISPAG